MMHKDLNDESRMSSSGSGVAEGEKRSAEGFILQTTRSGTSPRPTQHPGRRHIFLYLQIQARFICHWCYFLAVWNRGWGYLRRGLVCAVQRQESMAGSGCPKADPVYWGHPSGAQLHLEVSAGVKNR